MNTVADTLEITITLPDGSVRHYPRGTTVSGIAASIGTGLAKATLAGRVNGVLVDACDAITVDATVQIFIITVCVALRESVIMSDVDFHAL